MRYERTPLGRLLAKARIDNDITAGELADRLDISRSELSMIERGRTRPDDDLLAKLASALGLPAKRVREAANGR
jgi:transcriptional regulator with XRE-family HTH domain